jgi:hypothetical protein
LAFAVKHLCSEIRIFVYDRVNATLSISKLTLHPTGESIIHEPQNPNGKKSCPAGHKAPSYPGKQGNSRLTADTEVTQVRTQPRITCQLTRPPLRCTLHVAAQ